MTSFHERKRLRYRDGSSRPRPRKGRFFRPCIESLETRQLLSAAADPALLANYANNPMAFEANQGQTDPQVRFLSRGEGYALFLTATEAVLSLQKPPPASSGASAVPPLPNPAQESAAGAAASRAVLTMQLVGANAAPQVVGLDELTGKSNYLRGNDPAGWHLNVSTFARVEYQNVYPGINLIYHGNGQQLEYDFVISAGADPRVIDMSFQGAQGMDLDAQGNLVLHTAGGHVVEHAPVLFQDSAGSRQEVAGHYVLQGANQIGFQVGAYDLTRPLVIDPVLAYATYLGGYRGKGLAIAVDSKGNAFITGSVQSHAEAVFQAQFIAEPGTIDLPTIPMQATLNQGTDAFVTKFDPTGQIVYSTFLGGNPDESNVHPDPQDPGTMIGAQLVENVGTAIAVDAEGNVYLTGSAYAGELLGVTWIGFGPLVKPFQPTPTATGFVRYHTFVAKLNAAGSGLLYSSYLDVQHADVQGIYGDNYGTGIAVDAKENAYVVGSTIGIYMGDTAFVAKINMDGSLAYKETLGDIKATTHGNGIAVNAKGEVYVAGDTDDTTFAPLAFFSESVGGTDAYVAHLDADGALVTAVRLGGTGYDISNAIALDRQSSVYITGSTNSTNFPTTVDAFQAARPPADPRHVRDYPAAFVSKLNADLSQLVYSTYLAGGTPAPDSTFRPWSASGDFGLAIAVDAAGSAYVGGTTTSINFPNVSPAQPGYGGGWSDGFVAKLDRRGSNLVYFTYLGGDGDAKLGVRDIISIPGGYDAVHGIALDAAGNAYVVGTTSSRSFPVTNNAIQKPFPGGGEVEYSSDPDLRIASSIFIARLSPRLTVTALPVKAILGQPYTKPVATFTAPDPSAPVEDFSAEINWGDGTPIERVTPQKPDPAAPFQVAGHHSYVKPGSYPVVVTVTDNKHNVRATTSYNVSAEMGTQSETTVAVDPNNPTRVFTASNDAANPASNLFAAYSVDGGVTWIPTTTTAGVLTPAAGTGPLPAFGGDPRAVFDKFGNLYLTELSNDLKSIVVLLSADGGKTFRVIGTFVSQGATAPPPGGVDPEGASVDQPSIAAGPDGSVWVSYADVVALTVFAAGARVTEHNQAHFDFQMVDLAGGQFGNFGNIAVGPKGEVVATWQNFGNDPKKAPPDAILVSSNPDGLSKGIPHFSPPVVLSPVPAVNFGYVIPAQATRKISPDIRLAWDHSGKAHDGRLYLSYTDALKPASAHNDTDIFVRHSDDGGTSWSSPVRVNDDTGGRSQFFASIAVDQSTGDVGVSWYDARNDPGNTETQFFVAVSGDGGLTFSANVAVSAGPSDATDSSLDVNSAANQYGDYTGTDFVGGMLYSAWSDNSAALGFNPDLLPIPAQFAGAFDLAVGPVAVANVTIIPPVVTAMPIRSPEGGTFQGQVATFTDGDSALSSGDFKVSIDWGEGRLDTTGSITQGAPGTPFIVRGSHRYAEEGTYPIVVTITDTVNNLDSSSLTNTNVSHALGNQSEENIAVDPTNPSNLFAVSNDGSGQGIFGALSTNGGATWQGHVLANGSDLPLANGDPKIVFDPSGNLFLTYLTADLKSIVLALSSDDGQTFTRIYTFTASGGTTPPGSIDPEGALVDQPSVAAGAGSVWISFANLAAGEIMAVGAPVMGRGVVGTFGTPQAVPNSADGNFGGIAIGPTGQVLVSFVQLQRGGGAVAFVSLNTKGLGAGGFAPPVVAARTNFNTAGAILPAQATRGVEAGAFLAWDGHLHGKDGRVYLVYTDAPAVGSTDTNIFVRSSDDSGATWSDPVRVNDDTGTTSQFLPSIAVDPKTGDVAVGWYDARNDPGNTKTQFFIAGSSNGGSSFSTNLQVSNGFSDATAAGLDEFGQKNQYGDYTGIAVFGGIIYPVWADNSPALDGIPDPPQFDLATAQVTMAGVDDLPLAANPLNISADVKDEGEAFTVDLASFLDANAHGELADYTATIDWGDKTDPGPGVIRAESGKFVVSGKHAYESEGPYKITITINDKGGASVKVTNDADVADGKLTAASVDIKPIEGQPFFGQVATFTDTDPNGQPNDYGGTTIDWGNGQPVPGKVVFSGTAAATIINGNVYAISNQEEPSFNNQGQPIKVDVLYLTYINNHGAHPVMRLGSDFTGGLAYNSSNLYPYAISNLANGESFLNRLDIYSGSGATAVTRLGRGFTGGLTYDFQEKNFYAIATDGVNSALYSINSGTWAVTRVAELGALSFSGLIFDNTSVPGQARFYAVANDSDGVSTLYRIRLGPAAAVTSLFVLGNGFTGGLTYGFGFNSPLIGINGDGSGSATLNTIDPNGGVAPLFEIGAHYNDGFAVVGSHTYADESSGPISVFIRDMGGSHAIAESTFTVMDQPAVAYAPLPLTAVFQGFPSGPLTLAGFSVPGGAETGTGEYSATIDWGQGAPSAGLLSISGATITVSSSGHTYAAGGTFHPKVTLTDDSGGSVTVIDEIHVAPDVSNQVRVIGLGGPVNPQTKLFTSSGTIANVSGAGITGPLRLVIRGLPAGVELSNRGGLMSTGEPYLDLPNVARLDPGQTKPVVLVFGNPSLIPFTYSVITLDGPPGGFPAGFAADSPGFMANDGQADPSVRFLAQGSGYTLLLTPDEAVLALRKAGTTAGGTAATDALLRLQLIGANSVPDPVGLDPLPGRSNYLLGDDPSRWHSNVATYGRVEYENVYPGITLAYHSSAARQLEYDFTIAPGADPGVIRLAFQGVDSMTLDAQGNLVLHTAGGDIVEQAPLIYQESNGVRQIVAGGYVLGDNGRIGFRVAPYDHAKNLIIDPVLVYSTYLGGNEADQGNAIAVDAAGNVYVTGLTFSPDFPALNALKGAPDRLGKLYGGQTAFLTKFDVTGAVVFSTYLGGNKVGQWFRATGDSATGVALDGAGDVYLVGTTTSQDFPTVHALYPTLQRLVGTSAFVAKLNPTGSDLLYSTYLGGNIQLGSAIAVDGAGNAYVTGYGSGTFPTTTVSMQAAGAGAFVVKLSAAGDQLLYGTYLAGTNDARSIAVDAAGNAYVTGITYQSDMPVIHGVQTTFGGSASTSDAFVAKLNAAGTALVYSTYLGGSGNDVGNGIAVDAAGDAYVTGTTASLDFPTSHPIQAAFAGGTTVGGETVGDAFAAKLSADGSALVYSTYLGGSGRDTGNGIAVDAAGNAYVTGQSDSTDFPINNALQARFGGNANSMFSTLSGDAFVARLNAAGSALDYSTFLGGNGTDRGSAIAADAAGNAYVTGFTTSTNLRTVNPAQPHFLAIQDIFSFGRNAFVAKIASGGPGLLQVTNLPFQPTEGAAFTGVVASFTDTDTDTADSYTATIDWGDGHTSTGVVTSSNIAGGFIVTGTHTYAGEGQYAAGVTIREADGSTATAVNTAPFTAAATGFVTYHVTLDTSGLVGASGFLDFQFNSGALLAAQQAGVTVSNFSSTGGALTGAATSTGDVAGTLTTALLLHNTGVLNEEKQGFTFGSELHFDVRLDGEALAHAGHGLFGSTFSLALLGPDGRTTLTTTGPGGADVRITLNPDGATNFVTDATGSTPIARAVVANTVTVADAPLQAALVPIQAVEATLFSGTLATFTDGNTSSMPADFTAFILWGDGTADSTGTVVADAGGKFHVTGSHTYVEAGARQIQVLVEDKGGSAVYAVPADPSVIGGLQAARGLFSPNNGALGVSSLAVGDFNGDGKPDLAFSFQQIQNGTLGQFALEIMLSNGDGTFQDAVTVPAVKGTDQTVVARDVNGDGKLDLITAGSIFVGYDSNGRPVVKTAGAVYLGNGDGTFQPRKAFDPGNAPRMIVAGDFNGDSKLDLALVVGGGFTPGTGVRVLLGNGDGTFQAPVDYFLNDLPSSIVVGDFNRDGKLDLVVSGTSTFLLAGKGDGAFQDPVLIAADLSVGAAADLNGDGKLDLVGTGGGKVKVLLGNGDGTFQVPHSYFAGTNPQFGFTAPGFISVGDFNGDGKLDLAVADVGVLTPGGASTGIGVAILLGKGDGTFGAPRTFPTENVGALAAGDFNGDGKLDLALAGARTLSLLLGNGDGTLVDETLVPAGTDVSLANPHVLAVGDFNQDGRLDVVTGATQESSSVNVLLGTGGGAFQTAIGTPATGRGQLFSGDFNGDGIPDIVSVRNGVPNVAFGNGDGTYQPGIPLGVGNYVLAIGDFNGDGKLDVVVNGFDPNTRKGALTVLLGRGDGTFRTGWSFATGQQVDRGFVGDFNGDGKLDIALTLDSKVAVLLGNGDGTFQAPIYSLQVNDLYSSIQAIGDFNGDGKQDLVTLTSVGLTVLLGNGDGTFRPTNTYYEQTITVVGVAVADLNGDGKQDLVVTAAPNTLDVLLGNGDGTFRKAANYAFGVAPAPGALVLAGDFNGDGLLDKVSNGTISLRNRDGTYQPPVDIATGFNALALGDFNGDGKLDLLGTTLDRATSTTFITILLGNGDGTFRTGWSFAADQSVSGFSATVGDFNGDGKLDFVEYEPGKVRVFLGKGDGTFRAPVDSALPTNDTVFYSAIGDFNGDGKQDLVVTTHLGVSVLLGNGDGTFQPPVTYDNGTFVRAVQVADFNGDGKQDLVLTGSNNTFDVLLGNGDGTFQKPTTHSFGPYPGGVVVGNFTGHGKLDIATTTTFGGSGGVILLPGNGDGTFQQAVEYAFSGIDGRSIGGPIIADDVNKDGRPDLIVANSLGGADIFLAKADGSFQAGRNYAIPGGPVYLSAVDLNRDGKPDIIGVVNIQTSRPAIARAFVMLNRGDGTFQPAADYSVGLEFTGATQAVTGDFNGDGIPDLLVETYQPDLFIPGDGILSRGVLLGNVDGTLQKIQYAVLPDQLNGVRLVAGDFNGDGKLDLARFGVRGDGTPVLEMYLGRGNGTFETPIIDTSLDNVTLRTGDMLELAAADFNGDGKIDLVLNNSTNKSVSVLLGNGDGTFQKPIDSAGANVGPSTSYATGDLNGDGKIDLVTANRDGTVSLLLGNGDGTFQKPLTYLTVLTSNVFAPIPIVVADFNGDGVPDVGVLVGDQLAVLLNRRGHGPAQNVADAPLTATGANHPATKDVTFLGTVAHFTDANPLAPIGDFTATITWGDGHSSPGTIMPDGNGGFTVLGSNVFSTIGTFAVTTAIADRDGASATVSGNVTATAGPDAPLTASNASIAATARVAFSGTVATFTDPDASVAAGDFTATITWGDGHASPGFVRAGASVGFEVQGANTYAQPGNFAVTVAIVHTAGATASTTGSAVVASNTAAPLTVTGATIAPTERIPFTGVVATFTDGDPSGRLGDYKASIDWGDGQTSIGTVTADSQIAGQFDVAGSHAYRQVGTLPVTVTIMSRQGALGSATGKADIAAAPLTVHGLDVSATEGASFTGVVATFVDAIPFNAPSGYTASIDWGDGHTSPGTVTADPQAAGVFDVAAGNTYARFGRYVITITIDVRGHATTAQAVADAADAPLSALGRSINATAGSPYTGIVASFTDQDPAGAAGDYAATIFWDNGHISPGSITANTAGGFDVSGTNTYTDGGKSPVLVWIQDVGGASATATSTATIVEPTGAITAQTLHATEGTEFSGTVAWFTAPPNRQLGDFTAAIDWGDGHTTTGTFGADPGHPGQIAVLGTSTYAEEGQFTVAVTIATRGGVVAKISNTAIVADAPLTAGSVPVQAITGQTLTGVVATCTDADPAGQVSDFTAQINWGDGQASSGTITVDPRVAGQFDVTGTVAYTHRGSFPINVTITDAGGAAVVAHSTATIAEPRTAAGTSATAQAGVPFNSIVATIADANPEDRPGDFTATIDWGDGHTSPGLVTRSADGTNTFAVLGSTIYAKEGVYSVSVVLTRRDGITLHASSSVTVGPAPDAPLTSLPRIPMTAKQNLPATATVALFRDNDLKATTADFTATIAWGDGTTSDGRISAAGANSGGFFVVGSHTYTQPGAHLVTSAIKDAGGATSLARTGVVVTASQASGLTARGTSLQSFERSRFSGTVASFTDAATGTQPADFTAAIDWGDGSTSSGNITATGPGTFAVAADHTYLDETHFVIHVQIADHTGRSATAQSTMTVLEELLPDGTRGTPNQRFVSELYRDMLHRQVEPGGLANWSRLLDHGASRFQVALGIESSIEYRTDVVADMYHRFLHRDADPAGMASAVGYLLSGGSQENLQAAIVSSPEYLARRTNGTNAGFLDALYQDVFNRSVDPAGGNAFGAALAAGVSKSQIAGIIMRSDEFQEDLVRNIYTSYLDRDVEPGGLQVWLGLINRGASDELLLAAMLGEMHDHEFYDKSGIRQNSGVALSGILVNSATSSTVEVSTQEANR